MSNRPWATPGSPGHASGRPLVATSLRRLVRGLAGTVLATGLAAGAANAADLTMGISEGTSGGLDHAQVIAKYQPLANVIAAAIGAKVDVVFVREFKALESGMQTNRFDFMMARPSDYPARGLRDYKYRFVASAKPDGQCLIVVPRDSPIKTLADAKGKRFVMPEKVSYMSRFCAAELRDQGILLDKENVKYVREQGAVTFYMDNHFSDVGGLASYSGAAKKWLQAGNRVIHKSVEQPYFPLIASGEIPEAQVAAARKAVLSLGETPAGQAVLKGIGIERFDAGGEQRLRELLKWLGTEATEATAAK